MLAAGDGGAGGRKRRRDGGGQGRGLKALALADGVRNKSKTYAVACETLKFRAAIDQVLEKSRIDRGALARNEALLYVMLYDHLFGQGIKGGGAVKRAILAHDAKLKQALASVMALRNVTDQKALVAEHVRNAPSFPRFARVNTLKCTVKQALSELRQTDLDLPVPEVNMHIPQVLKFPCGTDLHDHPMVSSGKLILQDLSSCFPAFSLASYTGSFGIDLKSSDCIDATAAPGNKTSQLAACGFKRVFAFDKSERRLELLRTRMEAAGALENGRVVPECRDFLTVDPNDPAYANVRAILLDPSCSGSGMIGRVDHLVQAGEDEADPASAKDRLVRLSDFQKEVIAHAMKFPNVEVISYSTCSVNVEENEAVAAHAIAQNSGFKLAKALPTWPRRGQEVEGLSQTQAGCLARVDPAEDETCGFFVAHFRRMNEADDRRKAMKKAQKRKRLGKKKLEMAASNSAEGAEEDGESEEQPAGESSSKRAKV